MNKNNLLPLFALVPIIALTTATSKLPYQDYAFIRSITCIVAFLFTIIEFKKRKVHYAWSGTFLFLGILFNPIFEVHLQRRTWFYFDIGGASLFTIYLLSTVASTKIWIRSILRGVETVLSKPKIPTPESENIKKPRRYGWLLFALLYLALSSSIAFLNEGQNRTAAVSVSSLAPRPAPPKISALQSEIDDEQEYLKNEQPPYVWATIKEADGTLQTGRVVFTPQCPTGRLCAEPDLTVRDDKGDAWAHPDVGQP